MTANRVDNVTHSIKLKKTRINKKTLVTYKKETYIELLGSFKITKRTTFKTTICFFAKDQNFSKQFLIMQLYHSKTSVSNTNTLDFYKAIKKLC